jgi:dephospho-CoA kinase
VYLIGLTGGIGAGKSTVASLLADLGAVIIDADQVARDVVAVGQPALEHIAEAFGPEILSPDGSLNRPALGSIVFTNESAREKLNAIVHPAVRERTEALFAGSALNDVVVYDVPLLIEADTKYPYDMVVVAMAPEDVRAERLMTMRGMTESEARSRIEAQASDEQRLAIADVVIDTGGSLEHTREQVENLWRTIALRAHH